VATGDAVSEIALAVMATTLALVVVFLPTALMGGISGLLFKQFGWTVVVAVLASLLVARLLVPMLGAYLLKSERSSFETQQHSTAPSRPMMLYLATARMCLRNRKTSLALATLTLVASVALVPWIPTGLISASDEGYTSLNLELPPGSTLSNTLAATEATRLVLRDVPGIQQVFATIGDSKSSGRGLTRAGEVRMATLTLMLAPRGERESQADLESRIRPLLARVPGVRFTVGSGGLGDKLSIILASDNAAALNSSAQALVRELRGVAGLTGISSTAALERPEIIVRPDIQRAAERGVTAANLGATIRVATSGDLDVQLARLNLDQRQIYIRVRMPDAARGDPETLANLRVNGRGSLVPLSSVANLTIESGPSQISRYDRRRYVTVSADLGTVPLGEALTATKALPAVRSLPGSVHLSEAGGAEIMAELSSGFGMAILTGVLCIYCVLVLLFKDFLQPITILSAIPLSLGGAFVALVLGGSQLDVSSLIGLVLLMGIVTKNSILLVDYAIVGIRDRSLGAVEALIDACHMRARPIVMTTVAMIAGMLPIALGLGADASFRRPMAVAVIGGLITSTALSLFIVPVVFTYVDTLGHAFRRLFGARPSGTDRPLLQQATQADAT
jgi:multidrug efflux pump subunit AcrB